MYHFPRSSGKLQLLKKFFAVGKDLCRIASSKAKCLICNSVSVQITKLQNMICHIHMKLALIIVAMIMLKLKFTIVTLLKAERSIFFSYSGE